jgi:Zn-dependent protease with chaperone function
VGLPITLFAAILIAALPADPWDGAADSGGAVARHVLAALALSCVASWCAGRGSAAAWRRFALDMHRFARCYWLLRLAAATSVLGAFAWICWYGRWPAWVNGPGLGHAPETVRFGALLAPYMAAAAGRRFGFRAIERELQPRPPGRRDVRLTVLLLVPLVGLLAFLDTVHLLPGVADAVRIFPSLNWVLLAVPGGCLLLGAPLLLRLAWPTRPVAPGALRDVLEGVCDRAGFRCDDLRLWETASVRNLNAAVTGILQRWRSIFLTVPLVRRLPRKPLEAVLAHEIAHVQRRHLLVYTCAGLGFICWLLAVEDYAGRTVGADSAWYLGALAALTVVWWGGGFGVMSRAFERQADLDGAANVDDPEAMVQALEQVAAIAGQAPRKRAWRHGSIASRVAAVRAAADPAVRARFHRQARWLGWAAPVLAVAGVLVLVPPLRVEYALGRARLAASRGAAASARIWYERAVAIRPPDAAVHEVFGDICEEVGRPAEAREAYQRARAVALTNADVRRLTERIQDGIATPENP